MRGLFRVPRLSTGQGIVGGLRVPRPRSEALRSHAGGTRSPVRSCLTDHDRNRGSTARALVSSFQTAAPKPV